MTSKKTKTKQEDWKRVIIGLCILVILVSILFIGTLIYVKNLNKDKVTLDSEDFLELYFKSLQAEVIYGNLYVGYEDGVRIGYHQDYNGTWYRCARSCEEIK